MTRPKQPGRARRDDLTIKELIDLLAKHFPEDYISIEHHYNSSVYQHRDPTRQKTKESYVLYLSNHTDLNKYSIPSYGLLVAQVMYAIAEVTDGD